MFTVHVNNITQPKPKDIKEVKAEVVAKWTDLEMRKKVMMNALGLTKALDEKKTTLEKIAKDNNVTIRTGTVVRGSTPPVGIAKEGVGLIMATDTAKSIAIPDTDSIAVAVIDKVTLPEKAPSASELSNVEKNLSLDLQEERFVSFINYVERNSKVTVNHDLIDRLYGQTATE